MKRLIYKTTTNGNLDVDAFQRGLLELRNTPGACGRSPAEILYGRQLSSFVFAHCDGFASTWRQLADAADDIPDRASSHSNMSARPLPRLQIGDTVDVQDPAVKCGIPLVSLLLSADTVTIMSVCPVVVSSGGTADFFALSYL